MRRLMEWLRQGLCRHEWQTHWNVGCLVEGERVVMVSLRICRKCGKTERI